jgi:hypothetical protein
MMPRAAEGAVSFWLAGVVRFLKYNTDDLRIHHINLYDQAASHPGEWNGTADDEKCGVDNHWEFAEHLSEVNGSMSDHPAKCPEAAVPEPDAGAGCARRAIPPLPVHKVIKTDARKELFCIARDKGGFYNKEDAIAALEKTAENINRRARRDPTYLTRFFRMYWSGRDGRWTGSVWHELVAAKGSHINR